MNLLFETASNLLTGINEDVRVLLLSLLAVGFIVLGAQIIVSIIMNAHSSYSTDESEKSLYSKSPNKEDY